MAGVSAGRAAAGNALTSFAGAVCPRFFYSSNMRSSPSQPVDFTSIEASTVDDPLQPSAVAIDQLLEPLAALTQLSRHLLHELEHLLAELEAGQE